MTRRRNLARQLRLAPAATETQRSRFVPMCAIACGLLALAGSLLLLGSGCSLNPQPIGEPDVGDEVVGSAGSTSVVDSNGGRAGGAGSQISPEGTNTGAGQSGDPEAAVDGSVEAAPADTGSDVDEDAGVGAFNGDAGLGDGGADESVGETDAGEL